jgi:uncharacterized circularly permuted ATP-grasp superfamily protein
MSHLDDDAVAVTTRGASSSIPMGVIFVQQVLRREYRDTCHRRVWRYPSALLRTIDSNRQEVKNNSQLVFLQKGDKTAD